MYLPVGIVSLCLSLITVICLLTPVNGQAQSFRVAPQDLSIIKDQTAMLKCHIDSLKGRVQWTKNGFALGYDRAIPGFSRYSVIGNEASGEYDLMLRQVRLEDDAKYQCQVTPAGGDPPLVGTAKLDVLIPPVAPTIEGYSNGSIVRVTHEQASVNLTCVSALGKPAATITWMKGEAEIAEGKEYTTVDLDNKLQNATSVLTFKPEDGDDGSVYRCITKNDAMAKSVETRVILSVLHPPGPPEITGYKDGQVIKTGDTLKLKCTSRGGNPLGSVFWYKNDVEVDFSFAMAGDTVENELVFQVQPNDMNAVYKCEVSNRVTTTPLTSQVKLTVQFAPSKVTITGHESAKAGETITLKCESEISNPPAAITWFSRGKEVSGAVSKEKESPLGGFKSSSEIKVELTDRENDVIYQCHGTNEALGQTVVATVTLQVMYPPGQPTILGYTEGRTVTAGQIQTMSCTSKGGNPLATLTWMKGEEELQAETTTAWNMVQSQVSFILKPDDNRADYKCQATNSAAPAPLVATVTLNVNFPPSSLNISNDPPQIKAGQKVVITCKSSTSNPASVLTWWKDGVEITGIDGGIVDSDYFGKSTISKLELTPAPEENGEIYSCQAANSLIERAVSDAVTLNVLFKPKFPDTVPASKDMLEHTSVVLNFTALGNPGTIKYNWFKGTDKVKFGKPTSRKRRDVSLTHIIMNNGVLNIPDAKRTDTGVYTLKAKNDEGLTEHIFALNIQYAGGIKSVTESLTVDGEANATLECEVEANPLPDGAITWTREGYDMSRAKIEVIGSKSTLFITGADKDDSGEFTCNVNNGIGEPALKVSKLIVKFAPVIDKSPAMSKFAADKETTAKLSCIAKGAPEISFKWKKGETELDTTGDKYKSESSKVGLVQYQSNLSILNTKKEDYGPYICVATNELGEDTSEIKLDGTSKPDPPYEVKYINATHNSVTISWKPGFNGGSTQWFQVRYQEIHLPDEKQEEKSGVKYEDVIPKDATVFTVGGLKLATMYEMSVRGVNRLGNSEFATDTVKMSTSSVSSLSEKLTDDVPLYIILTVVIIGMVLLGLNVLLILLFIRKRKLRLEKDSETTSQANTVEMFNAPTITEDSKSYTSYGRMSLDEYPDEFYKPFDDEDEMRKFLPHNTYAGSDGPYPSYQRNGPSPYGGGGALPADYRSLPRGGGVGGVGGDRGSGIYPGAGSREGIIMDDYDAVASGLGPRSLDPYAISSLRRKDPEGAYMDSLHRSQQSLPSMQTGSSSQMALPQTYPAQRGGSIKHPPAPPARSSSKGSNNIDNFGKPMMPPVPSRNYDSEEIPRYAPPPESNARSGRGNLSRPPPPLPPSDIRQRGHLV